LRQAIAAPVLRPFRNSLAQRFGRKAQFECPIS
jgi:hypothetical protein